MLHRLSLVGPQVRTRAPPPGDAAASCCAFLLFIWRRRSRVSEGGDASVSLGLLRSRIPPAASAHPVRRPAGPAGASVLEVRSGGPGDRSISSELSTAAVSSVPSTPQAPSRSPRDPSIFLCSLHGCSPSWEQPPAAAASPIHLCRRRLSASIKLIRPNPSYHICSSRVQCQF
ncbi:hypothetical protein PVAP13_2NG043338 [Panicum virgatum]|uniref:Uncharacterized protein n=1 Tax=Panicum virgatum TaxID=38727 RepID=A0A8T0VEG3_PANVG|nr:hypothetical protein PVAP13_2NG043338 [Panicum virgatum]